MNILVLTETFFPVDQPTAKCLSKLVKYDSEDYFYIVSKGEENVHIKKNNFENIQINSYYDKPKSLFRSLKWFFYKIELKFYSIFKPYSLFDCKRFYSAGQRIIKNNRIDVIFCISAWFSTQKAGSALSKKYKIPMVSWYTDPFLANVGYRKYSLSKMKAIESRWLSQTNCVLMPSNYKELYVSEYQNLKEKFIISELPCFFEENELKIINKSDKESNIILHAGLIFPRINNFNWFYSFIRQLESFSFITLEGDNKFYKKNNLPKNFKRLDRVDEKQCLNLYSSACAILVVDNVSSIQIPSKAFEAISTNKPVVFIYHDDDSKTLELMTKSGNVFCIKEGTELTKELLLNLNNYIKLKKIERTTPYSNKSEINKMIYLLRKQNKCE